MGRFQPQNLLPDGAIELVDWLMYWNENQFPFRPLTFNDGDQTYLQ